MCIKKFGLYVKGSIDCRRETHNFHDRFAVTVIKVVGHVPTKISTICSLFLRSGTITCEVSGSRQYRARGLTYKVLINCGIYLRRSDALQIIGK